MNIEKHRAFLDSLEGEKGLPEGMHRLLIPGVDKWQKGDETLVISLSVVGTYQKIHGRAWDPCDDRDIGRKLLPEQVGRRAESRQIPDLKEKVKELIRDAMDLTHDLIASRLATDATHEFYKAKYDAFRSLCAPDKGGEVKP